MRKVFLGNLLLLLLLNAAGQSKLLLLQQEKDSFNNIRFVKLTKPVKQNTDNEIALVKSLLEDNTRKELSFQLAGSLYEDGLTHNNYNFFYNNVAIYGAGFSLHSKNGQILFANGLIPIVQKEYIVSSKITTDAAKQQTLYFFKAKNQLTNIDSPVYTTSKGLIFLYEQNEMLLCHKVEVGRRKGWVEEVSYINATNGNLIKSVSTVCKSYESVTKTRNYTIDKFGSTFPIVPPYVLGSGQSKFSGNVSIRTDNWNGGFRLRDLRNSTNILTLNANNQSDEDIIIQTATDFFDNDNNWTATEHPNDKQAIDVHWAIIQAYEYFWQVHNRSSYNNNGADIKGYVHTSMPQFQNKNAYWHLEKKAMFFGDGFLDVPPLVTLDICAHEFAHGVTQTVANLDNYGEEGALNEGFSDIWAATIEHRAAPSKQYWKIAEEMGPFFGSYVRNLQDPKLNGNPDCVGGNNWVNTVGCTPTSNNDDCGIHKNCTVLGHWYYLLVEGGNGWNNGQTSHAPAGQGYSWSVNSIGWVNAAKIVLLTEQLINNSPADWQLTRTLSIQAAQQLFGSGSCEEAAVVAAWHAVGLGNYPVYTFNGPEILCRNIVNTYTLAQTPPANTTVNWTITPNDGTVILTPNGNTVDVDASNANPNYSYTLSAVVAGTCYFGTGSKQFNIPTTTWTGQVYGLQGWYNTLYGSALVEGDNYLYTGTGANYFEVWNEGNNEQPNSAYWEHISGDYASYTGGPHFIGFDLWWLNVVDAYYNYHYTDGCGSHTITYHFISTNANPPNYRTQLPIKETYKLLVTPNPASTHAYLTVQETEINKTPGFRQFDYSKPVSIKVYDKMGKLLLQQYSIIPKTGLRLNIALLKSADIYNIIVNNEKGIRLSAKLIKQ